jgi:hypothetical protein
MEREERRSGGAKKRPGKQGGRSEEGKITGIKFFHRKLPFLCYNQKETGGFLLLYQSGNPTQQVWMMKGLKFEGILLMLTP